MARRKKGRNPHGSGTVYKWEVPGRPVMWCGMVELPRGENGKRHRKTFYEKTQKDAQAKVDAYLAELKRLGAVVPTDITVQGYLERWLTQPTDQRRPQTLAGYRTKLRLYVYPKIGNIKLQELTKIQVKGMYASMEKEGTGRRTIRLTSAILHKAFEDAVDDEWIPKNPAHNACSFKYKPREMKYIPQEQIEQVIQALANDWLMPFFYLSLFTGCRRGELCALQWSDVHLEGNRPYIDIRKSMHEFAERDGGLTIGSTKTEASVRKVSLPDEAVAVLGEHRKAQARERQKQGADWNAQNMVFTRLNGELLRPSLVTNHWKRIRERVGQPDIRLHDLRHSHATMLLAAGVSPKVIQKRLGHQAFQTTAEIYLHAAESLEEEALQKLNKLAPKVHLNSGRITGD